jgi:hypothetical protein
MRRGRAQKVGFTAGMADPGELRFGTVHEALEHGMSPLEAQQTALDHLSEDPQYYTHLTAMEEHFKQEKRSRAGDVV